MSPMNPPQTFRKIRDIHRAGLAADRPRPQDVLIGTLYFSTDTGILERTDGNGWQPYSSGSLPAPGPAGNILLSDGSIWTSASRGEWTPIPYSAANFFGSGAMTWTVEAGDIGAFEFLRVGSLVVLNIVLNGTTPGGTSDQYLVALIPFVPSHNVTVPMTYLNGANQGTGYAQVNAGSAAVSFARAFSNANWDLTFADATYIFCQIIIPV